MTGNGADLIKLIINADDLGECRAVNEGIKRAAAEGVVTSASLTPTGGAFDEALALLDELPHLGVGVHLTLVASAPLLGAARVPSLCGRGGRFWDGAAALARRYYGGTLKMEEVRQELRAQVERVLDEGVRVTHLDSHQHLHNLPGIAAEVINLGKRYGIKRCRLSRCGLWPAGPRWWTRQVGLRLYAEAFGVRARAAGIKTPDGLLGQEGWGREGMKRLIEMVKRLKPGCWELMCHPGVENAPGDPGTFDRRAEMEWLIAEETREVLEEKNVRLINFGAL